MKIYSKDLHFLAQPDKKHHISDFETQYTAQYDKKNAEQILSQNIQTISEIQEVFYADKRYSLLIVFQAMDAAGKDGTIKHVMSGINPQGCNVASFKQPTVEELDHDYLWRTYINLPRRGMIGIFDRSYYEEVLVTKVHPEIILNQRIPTVQSIDQIDKKFWENRYRQINNMEQHLVENGTLIIKFFLNISKDEQKKRFLQRIENHEKNWKLCLSDIEERRFWNQYMEAYSDMLTFTSTHYAPWYVIPADNKWFMRFIVSTIIMEKLQKLNIGYPKADENTKNHLIQIKKDLENESY